MLLLTVFYFSFFSSLKAQYFEYGIDEVQNIGDSLILTISIHEHNDYQNYSLLISSHWKNSFVAGDKYEFWISHGIHWKNQVLFIIGLSDLNTNQKTILAGFPLPINNNTYNHLQGIEPDNNYSIPWEFSPTIRELIFIESAIKSFLPILYPSIHSFKVIDTFQSEEFGSNYSVLIDLMGTPYVSEIAVKINKDRSLEILDIFMN
mgnify:CR=1 FL=1